MFLDAFHAFLHSTYPSSPWLSGCEEEEVGGAIHPPISDTKHTIMLVIGHTCLLESLFEALDRFGRCSWPEGSSLYWTPKMVRPTLDVTVASVQHPAMLYLPCSCFKVCHALLLHAFCESMLHTFLTCFRYCAMPTSWFGSCLESILHV